jgi:hypothetical protein
MVQSSMPNQRERFLRSLSPTCETASTAGMRVVIYQVGCGEIIVSNAIVVPFPSDPSRTPIVLGSSSSLLLSDRGDVLFM